MEKPKQMNSQYEIKLAFPYEIKSNLLWENSKKLIQVRKSGLNDSNKDVELQEDKITFCFCAIELWIHKGYFLLKKQVWNVNYKAFWYTK